MNIKKIETRVIKWSKSVTNRNGNCSSAYIDYETGERLAKCDCQRLSYSQADLPFWAAKPDKDMDEYYCGCRGF